MHVFLHRLDDRYIAKQKKFKVVSSQVFVKHGEKLSYLTFHNLKIKFIHFEGFLPSFLSFFAKIKIYLGKLIPFVGIHHHDSRNSHCFTFSPLSSICRFFFFFHSVFCEEKLVKRKFCKGFEERIDFICISPLFFILQIQSSHSSCDVEGRCDKKYGGYFSQGRESYLLWIRHVRLDKYTYPGISMYS